MQRRFLFSALLSLTRCPLAGLAQAQAPMPLRVLTHSSFDLPKELLAQFEKDAGVQAADRQGRRRRRDDQQADPDQGQGRSPTWCSASTTPCCRAPWPPA
jgi:hypothetical protein